MNRNFYILPFLRVQSNLNTFFENSREKDRYLPDTLEFDELLKKQYAFVLGSLDMENRGYWRK